MQLKTISFHLTNKCNMNCRHCLYSSGKKGAGEMNYKEIKKIIDEFAKITKGKGLINMFGGEVFLRDDIFKIINHAVSLGLNIGITTNANLPQDILEKIVSIEKIIRLTVDIDGASADSHEWLRNKEGHFNKTIKTIKFFVESGKFTASNIILHNKNVNEIESILELCSKIGLNFVSFYLFTPLGRGASIKNLVIGPEKWKEVRDRIKKWTDKNSPTFGVIFERSYEYIKDLKNLPTMLCHGVQSDIIDIRYDGNVYYCGLLSAVDLACLGNAKKESLSKIVNRRKRCAIKIKFGCPALAYRNNSGELVDIRPSIREIVPVCPYDWEVIYGDRPGLKNKFAHIDS